MLLGGWTTTRNRSWWRVKIPYGEENCPKYVGTILARSCSKRVQRDCVRRLTAVRFIHGTLRDKKRSHPALSGGDSPRTRPRGNVISSPSSWRGPQPGGGR